MMVNVAVVLVNATDDVLDVPCLLLASSVVGIALLYISATAACYSRSGCCGGWYCFDYPEDTEQRSGYTAAAGGEQWQAARSA
jgi:hypothetical protein